MITHSLNLQTDPAAIKALIGALQMLTAVRVHNPDETSVPDMTDDLVTTIAINNFAAQTYDENGNPVFTKEEKGVTLRIYPPSDSSNPKETVKSTDSDLKAVFELN